MRGVRDRATTRETRRKYSGTFQTSENTVSAAPRSAAYPGIVLRRNQFNIYKLS